MNNTSILSYEKATVINFNSEIFAVKTVEQFIQYYLLVLGRAVDYGFILNEDAVIISQNIVSEASERGRLEKRIIANYLYVITCYLRSFKTNYEQFEMLEKSKSKKGAETLIDNASNFFLETIEEYKQKIMNLRTIVFKLHSKILVDSLNNMYVFANEIEHFEALYEKVSLSEIENVMFLPYSLLQSSNEKSVLNKLMDYVDLFEIEVQILSKIGAKYIISSINSFIKFQKDNVNCEFENSRNKIKESIKFLKEWKKVYISKLRKFEKEYENKLNFIEESDRAEYQKLNPDLNEDEFEESFRDWQESLDESHFDIDISSIIYDIEKESDNLKEKLNIFIEDITDELEVENIITSKIFSLNQELDLLDDQNDDELFYINETNIFDSFSLEKIIKARFFMILMKNKEYTLSGVKELEELIDNVSFKDAVESIIKVYNFSDKEKEYLTCLI